MNTKNQLAVAITLAMAAISASASSPAGNSQYWTTTNGTVIVSANGNPVRTIHYKDKTLTTLKTQSRPQPKVFSSVFADLQKTVAKALNLDAQQVLANPKPVSNKEPIVVLTKAPAKMAAPTPAPTPTPTPTPTPPKPAAPNPAVVEKVVDKVVQIAKPVAIPKINYRYHNYKTTVLFDTASADLTTDATSNLKQVAMATKKADKVLSVRLLGHADTRGDAAYNMSLSQERISSVTHYFDLLNIKVTSMLAQGETSPVTGKNGEDLTLSRRVQVFITTGYVD
ncbi:OmpA family protein [Candidatus Njordibacter sp. Uisw_002]|uniref:OmpA family protein n=1 Tax=Candidatus Njordibacter sp. Uisw_002 TaxID=3230971 RepID=UPI003D5506D3